MIDIENNIATIEISSGDTYIEIGTTYIPPTIDITDAETLNGESPAYYLNRSNHTGNQPQSTITGLEDSLNAITSDVENLEINKLDVSAYNDRFKGLYATFFDLTTAHPTSSAGDYAQVDFGLGEDVIVYAWDASDEYWSAIGVVSIANTDALPEGSANLYFTETRVRGTALSTLSVVNSSISSLDSVISAFGKLQGQINNKENVITSGLVGQFLANDKTFKFISFSDITSKPTTISGYGITDATPLSHIGSGGSTHALATQTTAGFLSSTDKTKLDNLTIVDSEKTLVHKTTTKFYERRNSGNLTPFDLALRGLFESNYTIPANSLVAGDSYRIEFEIFIYLATSQTGNYGFAPIINGVVVPFSTEGSASLSILTTHQHVRGHIDFTCFSTGTSGIFGFDGYAQGRNGTIYAYSQTPATYNTTADITVNMSVRFSSTPSGANTARVVFGRLYKISN